MNTTANTIMKQLPHFSASRCKRCGVCIHFCPVNAIHTCDGMPFLADAVVCTSCGLCRDMCPDWAVSLEATAVETPEGKAGDTAAEDTEEKRPPKTLAAAKTAKPENETSVEASDAPSGNGSGSPEAVPATGD